MSAQYRTAPERTADMPSGIPFIIGNEAAERFSFYGMKAILFTFMTTHLVSASGAAAPMTEEDAKFWVHVFNGLVYGFPVLGALLADGFLGKYRVIIALSLVYCVGHAILAVDDTRFGLMLGLGVIAVGAGGIKPCVSAHVGDQFGQQNAHLIERTFGFFYLAINVGAFTSQLLTPWLLEHYGSAWGFGIPGVLMALATLVFWLGRHRYAHIPARGKAFREDVFGPLGRGVLGRLGVLYLFIAVFWALFDQISSSWIQQGKGMELYGREWLADAMQAANPFFVVLFIPLFTLGIYPAVNKRVRLTPMRKIGAGLFLASVAFVYSAGLQWWVDSGAKPSILFQLVGYALITAAEILVSVTALEYSYTQAPPRMKSFVMGVYLASAALGNFFTAGITHALQDEHGESMISGPGYFLLFAALMFVSASLFVPYAMRVREQSYTQEAA